MCHIKFSWDGLSISGVYAFLANANTWVCWSGTNCEVMCDMVGCSSYWGVEGERIGFSEAFLVILAFLCPALSLCFWFTALFFLFFLPWHRISNLNIQRAETIERLVGHFAARRIKKTPSVSENSFKRGKLSRIVFQGRRTWWFPPLFFSRSFVGSWLRLTWCYLSISASHAANSTSAWIWSLTDISNAEKKTSGVGKKFQRTPPPDKKGEIISQAIEKSDFIAGEH